MTTPTATSLPLPSQNNNNLARVSPVNSTASLPHQSPSFNSNQFSLPQHAGPSSVPRQPQPPSTNFSQPQQPIAGPSRSTLNQAQQFAALNAAQGQQQGSPQQGFNLADPQVHARLAFMAQQQAAAAAAAGAGAGNGTPTGGQERKTSQPDLAAMAAAMGQMQGQSREAIMKQLQALQNSQVQRAKMNLSQPQATSRSTSANGTSAPPTAPSPANSMTAPSPITAPSPMTAPSPAAPQSNQGMTIQMPSNLAGGSNPSDGSGMTSYQQLNPAGPSQQGGQMSEITNGINHQNQPNGNGQAGGVPMSQQQRDFLIMQQEKMRAAQNLQIQRQQQQGQQQQQQSSNPSQQPQQPHPSQLNPQQQPVRPPGQPGVRPPPTPLQQRQQFVASLAAFHRQTNQPLPPEIFNGERDGSFRVGDAWMDVVDLLMTVVKSGGIMNAMQQPPDSPLWKGLLQTKNIPNPLPRALQLPKLPQADPNAPHSYTTNPVQYLITAYLAWLQAFEVHMTKQRQAIYQRQAATAIATGRPPPPPPQGVPPLNGNTFPINAPSPSSMMNAPTPTSMLPPSPASGGPSFPSPGDAMNHGAQRGRQPSKRGGKKKDASGRPVPTPIKTTSQVSSPIAIVTSTPESAASAKKRKRDKKGEKTIGYEVTSTPSTPLPMTGPPPERPPTPKRARYKVEYRPIQKPLPTLGGWDRNLVTATFAKHSLSQGTRSIHDLAIVDMEAILMGLRSRMPQELGYAMTVLSMLSMPHPEENIAGLPLHHLQDIFAELLELIGEAAFGEEGWEGWHKTWEAGSTKATDSKTDLNKLTFLELEQLGRDFDFSLNDDETDLAAPKPRDQTGGQTDLVLAGLNILRNFSMFQGNQEMMGSRCELFNLLACVSDARLCRMPGDDLKPSGPHKPYSILELARVRRDCVCIVTNIGTYINLRSVPQRATVAIFRLLSTFLSCGWETLTLREPVYGPSVAVSIREVPPAVILSVDRALEAFCKLAQSDSNREVLGSVPASELVSLFESLIKLFPVNRRQFEAMHSIEDCLGYYECLALSLYSLVFLAPPSTRTAMRNVPGAIGVLTRVIFDTALQKPEFRANTFAILCRRMCETLGVLNGTVNASGVVEGAVSFSAGGIEGSGWRFASKRIEKGWLAGMEEMVLGVVMGVKGIDLPAFTELEGMCWGGSE
ncbi:hypothetical protein CI109_101790 [Kwoniella shandongensis]|uniref:Uncharacterized protein n=1 Tax=Kwoniella shandongensis TaxID=1734106 RepID=A0A5M6C590_9TREE|nr:uncharacterized protein CI109_001088 [Kwoniella shandongensis]KAA5530288.1 hypothetical protein CI109_001088 [Kwoniella shandongensis]